MSSGLYDGDEMMTEHTDCVNGDSLAEYSNGPRSGDDANDGSDSSWEDISDEELGYDSQKLLEYAKEKLEFTRVDDPERAELLNFLGQGLYERYLKQGNIADLDEAILRMWEVVRLPSSSDLELAGYLHGLAMLLGARYSRTKASTDLRDAIQTARQAVGKTPKDHPEWATCVNNLGLLLGNRYSDTGDVHDLAEAIKLARGALEAAPKDEPDYPGLLYNLGIQLEKEYSRTGVIAHLDEAIRYTREAVVPTQKDPSRHAMVLSHLGIQLGKRFLNSRATGDLEEAVQVSERAVRTAPDDDPSKAILTNLGIRLSDRYLRTTAKTDLDEAIQNIEEGLRSTPAQHPNHILCLEALVVSLGQKYSETGAIADLQTTIEVARQAVDGTPEGHKSRAGLLNNLGNEIGNLYLRTGNVADLEEAIKYLQQAEKIMPEDSPDRSALLCNLGEQLSIRYTKKGAIQDRLDALAYYQAALNNTSSFTLSRILAGRQLIRNTPDMQQAYKAASLTVSLIPGLSSRSLQNSDRQYALGQVIGLTSDAAAIALQAGQTPLVALGLLEQGRGVLGTSLEEVRVDILDLRDRHSDLAEQFVRLRDELDMATTQNPRLVSGSLEMSYQVRANRRYEAGKEFNELVAKIQRLPGFEDFLLPPSEIEIKAAARCGPIVIINVSKYRCDALLVQPHQVQFLPLSQLSIDEVENYARGGDLGSHEVLEWLWDKVAEPILRLLGFTQPPSSDESWPHVWWIPTGSLSKFPLHAAGYHSTHSTNTVLDRVMSSYGSSVKAIIHRRRRRLQPATGAKALLVAMEHTPGNDMLPFAIEEVAMIRNICGTLRLQPIEPGRRKQDVEPHLRDCKIFHFAGHGATDEYDASNSRLFLEDGTLKVAELLEINLTERPPFLAYLSACGTGRIRDERSVDESIHLMSAFQLAGFRHVIGTLWEVKDALCVDMAEMTYEGIRDGEMTDESVCRGLHHASRTLRDRYLREQFKSQDRSLPLEGPLSGGTSGRELGGAARWRDVNAFDAGPTFWAPYVHFGV
ncbi:TPR-like protein [Xylariaceae sp. FL1651]|nr:TPR-like protein [Xylariaceae sp. FL1651]